MQETIVEEQPKKKFRLPKCLSFLKRWDSEFYYYLFLVVMGLLFFAISLFTNYFTTPLTGDYTSQQYAFYTNGYDDWWRFFRTGQFTLYDTNTFLGASNIGSNSFYYLFDPFFLPVLIFPRAAIPQAMAIMTVFKMALAGLLFSKYLKYIGVKGKTARLAGLAYAFCGWTAWYLWFNHFTGVAVLFPVILWGVEKILREKKPWLLMLSVGMLGFCNFFFFFTFTVCAFLYAMFRFFQDIRKKNWRQNLTILGIGFFGFFTGCLLGMMVVLPAMVVALNAPRAQASTYLDTLKDALKSGDFGKFLYYVFSWESQDASQKVYYPIIDFIFPTMTNRGTPLTKYSNDTYDNVAGSIFCYSPFIIFFLPAIISSIRRKKFSHLIAIAIFVVMLFTPFVYYAFHGFTYAYSRWTLFVTTSLITYVAFYIDRIKEEPRWFTFIGGAFAIATIWAAIACAIHIANAYSSFSLRYVYQVDLGKYGFTIIEGVVGTIYVAIITMVVFYRYKKKDFTYFMAGFVALELIVMGALTLDGHGFTNYMDVNNGYENNRVFQQVIEKLKADDPEYYRCYSSQSNSSARNDSMRHDYNGLGMFHSVYNFNDYAFLNWSHINDYEAPGSYSASYVEKRQNLDTFLGVKYYFIHKDKYFWGDSAAQAKKYEYYRANVPLGFVDITDQYPNSMYYVYKNENFIDLGLSFDSLATYKTTKDSKGKVKEPTNLLTTTFFNEELYLKHAIVSEDKAAKLVKELPALDVTTASLAFKETKIKKLNAGSNNPDITKTYYDIGKDITVDRQDCSAWNFASHLLNLESSEYTSTTSKPKDSRYNGRYVTVINVCNDQIYDPQGMVFYLKNTYLDVNKINVYFTTEVDDGAGGTEERFLTFDNHNDSHLSNTWSSRKLWRGFSISSSTDKDGNFVPAPRVKNIIICARRTSVYDYEVYFEKGADIFDRLDTLKQNGLTDVHYKENHFDFKTDFPERRVVVTHIPYEDGWTIKATSKNGTTKNLEVFTAQGGFVSFISEKDETTYSMDFYTPYLRAGSFLSAIGEFMFTFSLLGYIYYKMYRDDKRIRDAYGITRIQNSELTNIKNYTFK